MTRTKEVLRWVAGERAQSASDELAVEEPLEIRVDTQPVSVTMRTPGHDDELAAGFLATEGIIASGKDVVRIAPHPRNKQNVINVFLGKAALDLERLKRHVFVSSSCGLCGKASIENVHQHFKPLKTRLRVSTDTVLGLPEKLRRAQEAFARSGGLHAAGIFTRDGELVVLREDVGRHNAVDKVIGHGLLKGLLPFKEHILMVSGRASFEIMQKSLAARIPVIAAVSAPSSLAVDFAIESGQTLVGFLRNGRMNLYAGKHRVS
jgi:FdhD protein